MTLIQNHPKKAHESMQLPDTLTDSHIHFYVDGKEASIEEIGHIIKSMVKKGITHLRDMGHKNGFGLIVKETFKKHIKISTAGYALYKKGGYGSFLGLPIEDIYDIPIQINILYRKGVDFIKVINSGIVTTNPKHPVSEGGFNQEELKIIVSEAKNLGLKVFCHVNGDLNIKNAIKVGVTTIEHGFFISEESIYMMKDYNVEWTPTINALYSIIKFLNNEDEKKKYSLNYR